MRRSPGASFAAFLTVFALSLAVLIHARETWYDQPVSLSATILWQLAIWLPWLLALKPLERVSEKLNRGRSVGNFTLLIGIYAALTGTHMIYFFLLSSQFSPLDHLPHTGFGVYPYFFIFFGLIDILILWGLSVRMGIFLILKEPPSDQRHEIITVRNGPNSILVKPETIRWIAAEDYYSRLHTDQGDYLLRQPLKVLIDRLPDNQFVRIHRSTIANIDFVQEADAKTVTFTDGTVRAMSRQGYKRFSEYL